MQATFEYFLIKLERRIKSPLLGTGLDRRSSIPRETESGSLPGGIFVMRTSDAPVHVHPLSLYCLGRVGDGATALETTKLCEPSEGDTVCQKACQQRTYLIREVARRGSSSWRILRSPQVGLNLGPQSGRLVVSEKGPRRAIRKKLAG